MSRRRALRESLGFFGRLAGEFAQGSREAQDLEEEWNPLEPSRGRLRPPGAVEEPLFNVLCTKCDECIKACPEDVLFRAPDSHGEAAGTPIFTPKRKACFLCSDLHCISACGEGALVRPVKMTDIAIGKARIDPSACRAYEGENCHYYVDMCPFPGDAITMLGERPVIKVLECVGCGLCEYYCFRETGRKAIETLPPPE